MTNRNRNMLIAFAVVLLAAVFWFALYQPLSRNIAAMRNEVNSLNSKLSQLTTEHKQKDTYLGEIDKMGSYIDIVNDSFPAMITQEMIIHTMMQIEGNIETLSIPTYTMGIPSVIIGDGEFKDPETGELKFRETLMETKSDLSLQMSYGDFKKLLAFIRDYDIKLSIENIQATGNYEEDLVSTSFVLNFYGLSGEDREFVPEDYFGPYAPKEDSIFAPFESTGMSFESGTVDVDYPEEEDDIILNLSPIYADRETVIIYKNNDPTQNSYIYTDNPEMESLEVVFEQVNGAYFYKYKTSTGSYPGNYSNPAPFAPGRVIDFTVYSTPRTSEDASGVNATVINNTDLPVRLDVMSDDSTKPRFNLVSQKGVIKLTRKLY